MVVMLEPVLQHQLTPFMLFFINAMLQSTKKGKENDENKF